MTPRPDLAKFEAVVAEDELRAAFDAVAPASGSAEGIVIAVGQPSITEVNSFEVVDTRPMAVKLTDAE